MGNDPQIEVVLEPELQIIDAHHHMRDPADGVRYLFSELLADLKVGHNILATVAVESNAMYRNSGPTALMPVGETEFLNGIAAMFASGRYGPIRAVAGIVGSAALASGEAIKTILDAHIAAGGGRFRGIRVPIAWDAAYMPDDWKRYSLQATPHLLLDPDFRKGFACLEPRNLSFDAHVYHSQLPDLLDLAKAFSETRIIVNHYAAPLGVGPYRGKSNDMFLEWQTRIRELAACPNLFMKLGGIRWAGIPVVKSGDRPNSQEFAAAWRPYIETCIQSFGPDRCMFESNFPSEQGEHSYLVLWNAFKRVSAGYSVLERSWLFHGTAARAYRLDL